MEDGLLTDYGLKFRVSSGVLWCRIIHHKQSFQFSPFILWLRINCPERRSFEAVGTLTAFRWSGCTFFNHFTVEYQSAVHRGRCQTWNWGEEAHNPLLTNCYEVECWCKQRQGGFTRETGEGDGWKRCLKQGVSDVQTKLCKTSGYIERCSKCLHISSIHNVFVFFFSQITFIIY